MDSTAFDRDMCTVSGHAVSVMKRFVLKYADNFPCPYFCRKTAVKCVKVSVALTSAEVIDLAGSVD